MEAFVSSKGCNGGGGVAFSVDHLQCFSGSRLLQQEVHNPRETSTCCEMQQSLLRIQVLGRDRREECRKNQMNEQKRKKETAVQATNMWCSS